MCLSGGFVGVVRVLFGFLVGDVRIFDFSVIVMALNGGICCSVRVRFSVFVRFSDIRVSGFMVGEIERTGVVVVRFLFGACVVIVKQKTSRCGWSSCRDDPA